MKTRDALYWILVIIALLTIVSGLVQIVGPGFELRMLRGEATPTSCHFFGIVGMFMVLFGGAMLHALLSPAHHPVVVLWAGLQKLGAFVAVGLAVYKGLLAPLALGVAGFDFLSGILALRYWRKIQAQAATPL